MMASPVFRLTIFVVALSTLIVADPNSIIKMNSVKVTNNANDYFDPWELEVHQTKRSSQLTVKIPTKTELPDTMMMQMSFQINGGDAMDYDSSLCDALSDETIGKSFVDAGIPKDKFPKECPFGAGDWTVSKWDPPAEKIPPGTPDGPITGNLRIVEEGKDKPLVLIEFEGELSHR